MYIDRKTQLLLRFPLLNTPFAPLSCSPHYENPSEKPNFLLNLPDYSSSAELSILENLSDFLFTYNSLILSSSFGALNALFSSCERISGSVRL